MSKIEKLIKEKCPDGVEYKKLAEICDIYGRIGFRGYTREDQVQKGMGAISLSPSNIKNEEIVFDNCTYISWYKYEESPEIQVSVGDIIFGKTASVGKTALVKSLPEKATINPQLVLLKNIRCNNIYLSYVLKTYRFQREVEKIKGLGTIPTISQKDLGQLEIPVPPIEVQQEIVRILNKFTALEAGLQAELKARKKQYEYYREKLLNFGNDVEYRSLGDSCYIKARIGWQKLNKSEYLSEGEYYLVTGVNITKANRVDFGSCYFVSKERYDMDVNIQLQNGDIIITKDGTIGKVALIEEMDKPAVLNSHLFVIRDITGKLNHKFLLYIFLSNYFARFVEGNKTSGTIAGLNQATMVKFSIPFPSLDEQEHIVGILDKFVQLIESLTKEIEARHKQYEYYRDKLLTFERKVV